MIIDLYYWKGVPGNKVTMQEAQAAAQLLPQEMQKWVEGVEDNHGYPCITFERGMPMDLFRAAEEFLEQSYKTSADAPYS